MGLYMQALRLDTEKRTEIKVSRNDHSLITTTKKRQGNFIRPDDAHFFEFFFVFSRRP